MTRCRLCIMPDTRPDSSVFVNGVCPACLSYAKRPTVDWEARKEELKRLLDRFHGECIVPSSGGKDSTYQVLRLLEMGAHVTCVTASTCFLTPIGRVNLDNLSRHATTIEVTPNRSVRAKLNRLGLELVGDISWPEHASIFTTPFRVASQIGKRLVFYGENPQNQYGGPLGSEEARQMTVRWRSEFGGFLGLRPSDLVGQDGITARDMQDYEIGRVAENIEAHFLGQYEPWDSHRNAEVAIANGFSTLLPSTANWWAFENLDNAQTGLHDWFMFLKYGYSRATAQLSIDIRAGRIDRETALGIAKNLEGRSPYPYCGVSLEEVLDRIGLSMARFTEIESKWASPRE